MAPTPKIKKIFIAPFALEIIAEAVVAEVLANAVAKRLGGDTAAEVKARYDLLA